MEFYHRTARRRFSIRRHISDTDDDGLGSREWLRLYFEPSGEYGFQPDRFSSQWEVFASPATVSVSAEWYISGAYVTNVSVFANSTLVTSTPLKVLKGSLSGTTDLGAGNYSLVSVLSGPGVNYTSAPVNITVVEPVSLAVGAPQIQGAQFAFQYTVNPGLKYLIESSSDLQVWQPVVTNVPTASPAEFSEAYSADARRFYRVGRLPNP
jgi:hypothetical protein